MLVADNSRATDIGEEPFRQGCGDAFGKPRSIRDAAAQHNNIRVQNIGDTRQTSSEAAGVAGDCL